MRRSLQRATSEGVPNNPKKETFFGSRTLFSRLKSPAAEQPASPHGRPLCASQQHPSESSHDAALASEGSAEVSSTSARPATQEGSGEIPHTLTWRSQSEPLPPEALDEMRRGTNGGLPMDQQMSLPLSLEVRTADRSTPAATPPHTWAFEVLGRNHRGGHSRAASKGTAGRSMVHSGPLSGPVVLSRGGSGDASLTSTEADLQKLEQEVKALIGGPLRLPLASTAFEKEGSNEDLPALGLERSQESGREEERCGRGAGESTTAGGDQPFASARSAEGAAVEAVEEAALRLRQLSKGSKEERRRMVMVGVLGPLTALLGPAILLPAATNAALALSNLALDAALHAPIVKAGAVSALVQCLTRGACQPAQFEAGAAEGQTCSGSDVDSSALPGHAALALFNLSASDEYKLLIARAGAVAPLVGMLTWRAQGPRESATLALFSLSLHAPVAAQVVAAGGVGALLEQHRRFWQQGEEAESERTIAVAALSNLARSLLGCDAILGSLTGVTALVEALEEGAPRTQEDAAATLLLLCEHSPRAVARVRVEGLIPTLVGLAKMGRPRCRVKARALLPYLTGGGAAKQCTGAVPQSSPRLSPRLSDDPKAGT